MADFNLLTFFDTMIAEDLGIRPEQVTTEFIHEMRKHMHVDPDFQHGFPPGSDQSPTLKQILKEHERSERWKTKCRAWAQEVLLHGATPC